jgi:hypothetical protein
MTKLLLALLASGLLTAGAVGCAGSSPTSLSTVASQSAPKHDRDDDSDHNDDDARALDYGHAAVGAERQAITNLLIDYYAAAAAADGARACALLMPFVAESVAENYGNSPGLQGKTCAVVISKLFKQKHQVLSGESATLKVYSMRVGEERALTLLSFSTLPEVRAITARRDGNRWKVLDVLDGILE